jgi:hypothetical protein
MWCNEKTLPGVELDGPFGSGRQTADVIQKQLFVPLRDYRGRNKELDNRRVEYGVKCLSE